jgi:hypothetical protein
MRENTIIDTGNKILDEVGRFLDWDPGRAGIIQLFTGRALRQLQRGDRPAQPCLPRG